MSKKLRRPLFLAIATSTALGLLTFSSVVSAQASQSLRENEQRARGQASDKDEVKEAQQGKPAAYPNATRKSPEVKVTPKMGKHLQVLQQSYDKEDWAGVVEKATEIGEMADASAYAKAFAYSMAGNAAANEDDQAKAEQFFAKAVAADGLDNDGHFSVMYNLAVTQFGEEKYEAALATLDRFLTETKSDKADQLAFRAGILANLDRYSEAAAIYRDLLAKNPTDKRVLMNAVAALQNGEKYDEANLLLEDAYKRGMLTESRELRSLYIGYMNTQRWNDAQKVIEDGLAKGVLQAGPDLARDYQVLAQNAYQDDKMPLAIELYSKAAPMAADGEAYLNLAKVLDYAGKKAEAKAAAKQALEKGVKKPEDANRILAR